jgi:DNA-binding transcriptional MerR regulator
MPVHTDAPISFAETAESLGIGKSTLREWRRKRLFPEPKHHNGGLWFNHNQVSLLKELKAFFQKYSMRPGTIKQERLKEVRAVIDANWP